MGLFSFLKKEKKTESNTDSTILGMILLEEPNSMEIEKVISELKNKWNLQIGEGEISNETSVFEINGYRVAIANMPIPVPTEEVTSTAEYNYLWNNGVQEVSIHKAHIILSIINAGKNPIQENILFSKIASTILNNSKAIGIYIGGRTLVLKTEFYQSNVVMMSEDNLPLYIWVYFGLRQENGKQSVYTYGLSDFGKMEMEIVNSNNSLEELSEMMFNLVHYVISYDVILKDGETIGLSATQKLKISESKGRFLEGKTLKIKY